MLVAIETARALTYQAVSAVAEGDPSAAGTASSAKAAMGACQRLVTAASLDIHGHPVDLDGRDLRLWVGRAKADDLLLGTATDHRRIVADHMLSTRRARSSQLAAALVR